MLLHVYRCSMLMPWTIVVMYVDISSTVLYSLIIFSPLSLFLLVDGGECRVWSAPSILLLFTPANICHFPTTVKLYSIKMIQMLVSFDVAMLHTL
ncbi:hypothetical protein BJ165DRAFT_1127487 [Panaeolus papilionaceus]|nr:hypothetical protein BJ165DRAFT_1127487 [Panaeolus papilionaceus]